ncbi:hypothetical protein KEM60_00889 [Austwickia sp. TVS 96-490-7B]|uniref:GTP-binding protein n=1 Tax=Austwickia sp. TVS 96-490-7B TaxID=2830843 RepID=UPI001C565D55|nr:GTP-binding protein [Austwickia sp. TVS 96-490-7B]MBW3084700.1 hypothetical protein [Austwickia sp. TVS 96-490-7B]
MATAPPLSIHVVVGLDQTDQALVAMGLQIDLPDSAVFTVTVDAEAGRVHWTLTDVTGRLDHGSEDVEHPCLSCSIREAILPTLVRLAQTGQWSRLVVVLPVASEPLALTLALADGETPDGPASRYLQTASVVAVVSAKDLCDGIFGDDLLADLGLQMIEDDRRAYGEVLVAQIELADEIVLVHPEPDEADQALLDHLRRPSSQVHVGLENAGELARVETVHDTAAARSYADPRRRHPSGADAAGGIVTLDLCTWKPFHPERLLARIEDLGAGDQRARGAFWLPGRPDLAIAWEAAGGALAIGSVGEWEDAPRQTRLIVTTDEETALQIREAFDDAVMSDAEMMGAAVTWAGRDDGFAEWLGEVESGTGGGL